MTGRDKSIRIDEPPDGRIVIPCLEVIEAGLGVVVVSAVAEGVLEGDRIIAANRFDRANSPRIVRVRRRGAALGGTRLFIILLPKASYLHGKVKNAKGTLSRY